MLNIEKLNNYTNIYQVDCFNKEFENALSETKVNGRYHKWLRRQLNVLDSFGKDALKMEQFEKLTDINPNLYSIRHPHSKKNERVIYIYLENDKVFLIYPFLEQNDSDYHNAISVAKKRVKFILESL